MIFACWLWAVRGRCSYKGTASSRPHHSSHSDPQDWGGFLKGRGSCSSVACLPCLKAFFEHEHSTGPEDRSQKYIHSPKGTVFSSAQSKPSRDREAVIWHGLDIRNSQRRAVGCGCVGHGPCGVGVGKGIIDKDRREKPRDPSMEWKGRQLNGFIWWFYPQSDLTYL